jgi:SPP1 gp7 family putative phage head morphogenesis protein
VSAFAATSRLLDAVIDLYDSTACCPDLDAHAAAQNVDPKERKLFEALAKARHASPDQSRPETLQSKEWKDLYQYVSNQLMGGAEKGYGKELVKLDFDTPDHRMLSKLSESLHWFSANKNWQLLVDINAQLKTTDGKLREWADFKKEALRLDKQYNTVWLRTEYNAAVASAQMAGKWVGFEERQDETYLRFDTAGDRRVRPAHVQLDGITLPATDKFWSSYFPPLDWSCRCDATEVLRSRATPTDLQQRGPLPQIAEGFKSNVGKSGQVFDETHPYFGGVPKAEAKLLRAISDEEAYAAGAGQQYQDDLKAVFGPKNPDMEFAVRRMSGARGAGLPELTAQEKALIYDYTKDGYKVNQALMGKRKASEYEESYTRLLTRALDKLPNHEGQVYRRIKLPASEALAQYRKGQVVTEKAFGSTSFVHSNDFEGNVTFVMDVKQGKRIREVSQYEDEDEILMRPNTRYEVLRVQPGLANTTIYLTEVIVP